MPPAYRSCEGLDRGEASKAGPAAEGTAGREIVARSMIEQLQLNGLREQARRRRLAKMALTPASELILTVLQLRTTIAADAGHRTCLAGTTAQ